MKRILICDGYNVFCRSYCAYPSMTADGKQVGGAVGMVKTLRRLIEENRPDLAMVVWESGGSARRRSIYSEYKVNRKPPKLNRFYEDIPESDENRTYQVEVLVRLLGCLPICQVYVPDCEGDDVISYLCRARFRDDDKTIVSTDRDFYQLLDDPRCRVYNVARKAYVLAKDVLSEFTISARNFALAKAVCGDSSDNVAGVRGVGFKTLAKRVPTLMQEEAVSIDQLLEYCHARKDETPFYGKVVSEEAVIRRNWKLVHLDSSMLTHDQRMKIDAAVENFVPAAARMEFMQLVLKEGIRDLPADEIFSTVAYLQVRSREDDGEGE